MNQLEFKRLTAFARSHAAASALVAMMSLPGFASAHHPDRAQQPVYPRIDVIGPIGNRLPPGHRRKYNRPSYLGGWIAYKIAPSSQEAMVWHRAVHAGAYQAPKKHLRIEQHYFYPKPWQALTVGPRRATEEDETTSAGPPASVIPAQEPEMIETEPLRSTEPLPQRLPESAAEPELELPDLDLGDAARSPSDAV